MKTVGRARGVKTVCCVRGVKTVGRACVDGMSSLIGLSSFAGAVHAQDADGQWSRWCEDGGSGVDGVKTVGRARGVKTVGRASGDGTSSLIGLSSFTGAAHAQAACAPPTASGFDCVKSVERARGVKTVGLPGSSAAIKAAPSGVPWTL